MVIFAVLILGAAVVLGFFASANGGTHDVNLFGQTWNAYDWVPPVIAAGVMGLLLLVCMAYAAMRIGRNRRANVALRTEVEKLRNELGTMREGRDGEMAPVPVAPVAERQLVGRGGEPVREREIERREPMAVAAADEASRHRPVDDGAVADPGDSRVGQAPAAGSTGVASVMARRP